MRQQYWVGRIIVSFRFSSSVKPVHLTFCMRNTDFIRIFRYGGSIFAPRSAWISTQKHGEETSCISIISCELMWIFLFSHLHSSLQANVIKLLISQFNLRFLLLVRDSFATAGIWENLFAFNGYIYVVVHVLKLAFVYMYKCWLWWK